MFGIFFIVHYLLRQHRRRHFLRDVGLSAVSYDDDSDEDEDEDDEDDEDDDDSQWLVDDLQHVVPAPDPKDVGTHLTQLSWTIGDVDEDEDDDDDSHTFQELELDS